MAKDKYDIGYGKPPKKTRFKPGQSGNPRGRPKESKNTISILKKELDERISLREGDKQLVITKRQAMLRHLINKAVQGDTRAMFFVYQQMVSTDISDSEKEEVVKNISEEDSKILIRFLKENTNNDKKKNK